MMVDEKRDDAVRFWWAVPVKVYADLNADLERAMLECDAMHAKLAKEKDARMDAVADLVEQRQAVEKERDSLRKENNGLCANLAKATKALKDATEYLEFIGCGKASDRIVLAEIEASK